MGRFVQGLNLSPCYSGTTYVFFKFPIVVVWCCPQVNMKSTASTRAERKAKKERRRERRDARNVERGKRILAWTEKYGMSKVEPNIFTEVEKKRVKEMTLIKKDLEACFSHPASNTAGKAAKIAAVATGGLALAGLLR